MDEAREIERNEAPIPPVKGDCASDRRLKAVVYSACARWGSLVDTDTFADCLQEASIEWWRIQGRLAELPDEARQPFVDTCVRRRVQRVLQREFRLRFSCEIVTVTTELEAEKAPASDLELQMLQSLIRRESGGWIDSSRILDGFLQLPDRARQLLTLYYFDGLSDPEIAVRLGTTPGTVHTQRQRLIVRLRRLLNDPDPSGPPSRSE